MSPLSKILTAATTLAALAFANAAHATDKKLCVYDPAGSSGDAYQTAQRYTAAAQAWGVNFTTKAYTDEAIAASDFANSNCDAVLLTGVRTQQFNRKSYSVEALGLTTNYNQLRTAVQVLAKPNAASLMVSGQYETVGIYPAGAVYLYVRDRSNIDISVLAGKKIATMDFDKAAPFMAEQVGASAVASDIGNFAQKFNNGAVFACYAPATAYSPLELRQGLSTGGGVIQFPLAQLTLQMLIRPDEYPDNFGQQSREWAAGQFDSVLRLTTAAEATINNDGYWISLDPAKTQQYRQMLSEVRGTLVTEGAYDPTIVKLVERIAQ
jgi:hypothetical protein